MTGTCERPGARPATWPERLFVLGGLGVAALCTAAALALGTGAAYIGLAWMAGVGWAALASLALALRRGLRHRDWSAFRRHELPDSRDDLMEWSSKTGAWSHMRDWEDRHRHDDDPLR